MSKYRNFREGMEQKQCEEVWKNERVALGEDSTSCMEL